MADDPVDPASTSDLLDRARAGDEEALNALFARHMPRLRRWASGRLPQWARDIADTTDLVQDTVIGTLRRLDGFEDRGDGALQAYLRQAVLNRVRNELRRSAVRGVRATLESSFPDPATSPLDLAIGSEALEEYERALSTLSPDEREAVVQRFEFGLSYDELAAVLGKPTGNAARMAVVRALAKVAREMRRP